MAPRSAERGLTESPLTEIPLTKIHVTENQKKVLTHTDRKKTTLEQEQSPFTQIYFTERPVAAHLAERGV